MLPWGSGAQAYIYFPFPHPRVDTEAMSQEHPPHQNQTMAALITCKNANSHDAHCIAPMLFFTGNFSPKREI